MTDEADAYTITFTVPQKRITELLFGHGGSVSDWMKEITNQDAKLGARVVYDREADEEGTFGGSAWFTPADIAKGLSLMAADPVGSHQWAQFMAENDDDLSFDVAWQFIIFGKLVFG